MKLLGLALTAWLACAVLVPEGARARVERYAVVIGNNVGASNDQPLRYAEADAQRMYDVLHDLGGFEAVNMVVLRDERAETVRRTLIALNDRIRHAMSTPDTQAMLLVYYSGHADNDALHLRDSRFEVAELAQLARGSAANVRLVVLDSCRSGSLTRTKGGKITAPFALEQSALPGDGLAFLTASSAHEDAQESDELKGSFFTHALVSGLLGAADRDGDGAVVLDEAYRYAYDGTLRATSRTLAGTQHPSFRYDLRGQGDLGAHPPAPTRGGARAGVVPERRERAVDARARRGHRRRRAGERHRRARGQPPTRALLRARARSRRAVRGLDHAARRGDSSHPARCARAGPVRQARAQRRAYEPARTRPRARRALADRIAERRHAVLGRDARLQHRLRSARPRCARQRVHRLARERTSGRYDQRLRPRAARVQSLGSRGAVAEPRARRRWRAVHADLRDSRQRAEPPNPGAVPQRARERKLQLGAGYHVDVELAAETYFLRVQDRASSDPERAVGFALRPTLALGKRF